jgi:hypothetical protein
MQAGALGTRARLEGHRASLLPVACGLTREVAIRRIDLHNVAPAHQERFIDLCGTRLVPALARAGSIALPS